MENKIRLYSVLLVSVCDTMEEDIVFIYLYNHMQSNSNTSTL